MLTRRHGLLLLCVALCACGATRPPIDDATVAVRLARFEQDCGLSVQLPMARSNLEAMLAQSRVAAHPLAPAPLGGHSGDELFPPEHEAEFEHGEIAGAILVICPSGQPTSLWSRYPRFAFYADEAGMVFHVEDVSQYLG